MTSPVRRGSDPGASLKEDDLSEALELVSREYGAASGNDLFEIRDVSRFGKLFVFTPEERDQLMSLRDLIKRYVVQPEPPRPLSLGVFGQPGSGKSFAVKQILTEVASELQLELDDRVVNLTQVSDSGALAEVLKSASEQRKAIPAVLFDEFDAPRAGALYGWLAWFLAPMQDGEFVHDGAPTPLKRAIYVFAGGTAASMQQFADLGRLSTFRAAKGPDFISRLRGSLDVNGPNAKPRMLRRAVLLRTELEKRAKANGKSTFRPQRELLESLLQVGRYRHGARSIAAVVELSDLNEKKRHFGWEELPEDHLLRLHIDRGPLNSKSIGGAIALSGYRADFGKTVDNATVHGAIPFEGDVAHCWRAVAHALWGEGATLSYAGGWRDGSRGWLMKSLAAELQKRPLEPSANQERREKPDPWLESFVDDDPKAPALPVVNAVAPPSGRERCGLHVTIAPHLTDEERGRLDAWLRQVLERFRRRLAVTEISVARFVVAGAATEHYGRFPGISEEVMLTLVQGKPVYIAGGFGGAAWDVGRLLGLSHPRVGNASASFQTERNAWRLRSIWPKQRERSLLKIADELRPGPWTDLAVTASELVLFLRAHAVGGLKWPDNGLTSDENRELFRCKDPAEVARLVTKGLMRRFGAP